MKDAVDDDASINFRRAFYNSLGEGNGAEVVFNWGMAESQLLCCPNMIRPLLIKEGTRSEQASEDAQKKPAKKSNNPMLSKRKIDVGSAQSTGFPDDSINDEKTALAEVDEDGSETTDDEGM